MVARTHARNLLAIVLIAALSAAACGGGATEPATADRAGDDTASTSVAERDDAESVEGSDGEAPSVAKKAACDDGTCTLCGEAQCPTGWYCDEGARGGPACGWLPECAKKPTCACVKRVFSGSCEERNGGLYIKE